MIRRLVCDVAFAERRRGLLLVLMEGQKNDIPCRAA